MIEHTSTQNAIRDLQTRNHAMLRVIPDVVFVLLPDGTFVDCHAREPRMLFAPRESVIGRTVREVMPSAPARTLMNAVERAARTDEPVVVEYEMPFTEPRSFEARFVRAEHGRVLGVVRDVTESKRTTELNRDLAGRLIASQEAERTRIARDLHDGVCQDLASLAVEISRLRRNADSLRGRELQETLVDIEGRVARTAETLRLLSHGLHPSVLQHIGLIAALQSQCAEVERQHQLRVRFFADDGIEARHPIALSLFRIAQEALGNVARHGDARHAAVSLVRDGSELVLIVSDDGCGFDLARARRGGGLGLVSMEERARLVGGFVTISTAPGFGTTIEVRVAGGVSSPARGQKAPQIEIASA